MRTKQLTVVGLVMGLIVGGTLAFAGVTFAGTSPPTSVNTCTKINKHGIYGNPKVTTASSCTGTKYFQTWNNGSAAQGQIASLQAQNVVLSKYKQLMIDSDSGVATTSYAGLDFTNMDLPTDGVYSGFNFKGANFTNSFLTDDVTGTPSAWIRDDFTGANFTNAILAFGDFNLANFTDANVTNANLTNAEFTGATMTGVTYNTTICPNGTNSNSDGGTCAGQGGGL